MLDTDLAKVGLATRGSIVHDDVDVVTEGLDRLGHDVTRELFGITAIGLDGDGFGVPGLFNGLDCIFSSFGRSGVR